MATDVRFESSSASQEDLAFSGSYPNGQRMSYMSSNLDRSGSFRESGESRMLGSVSSTSRGCASSTGDLPLLPQVLLLDPITIGDHKFSLSDELRRLLSFGSTMEDNSCVPTHFKFSTPVAADELKRLKASVIDSSRKARCRAKRFGESLHKLNKYCEVLVPRKQQRSEILTNDRSGGSNLLKFGTQVHRNSSDVVNQRVEDRPKNGVLNKRVRSSVAEIRAEGRASNITRQPYTGKDRDSLTDGCEGSDLVEENIRRLPAGGETWDRKMKRKRSAGAVFTRPMDSDGELKRVGLHRPNNESGLQFPDAQSFRSGPSNGPSGTNNLDGTSLPPSSSARAVPKNEMERVTISRDPMAGLSKERLVVKGSKLNVREDHHIVSPNLLAKGKGSRAPRTGPPLTPGNSSSNFPQMSGVLDAWEHPPSLSKVHSVGGTNNRKRSMPTASSSPPMAQWVGQRPPKMSRTRRANVVSPVSNHDEVQLSSEGCSPTELGGRMTSLATNGSLLARGVAIRNQQIRVKHENVPSPARLSETEESGGVENHESRLHEKGPGSGEVDERALSGVQNIGPSGLLTKKSKVLNKDEIGDSVRRQGRSGRGPSFSRASISPLREKLESPTSTKPLKSTRPGSEKNGRRPPSKKMSDHKAFNRLGQTSMGGSSDFTGESEDDREELLTAANFACDARYSTCSSTFWRKMESAFALSSEDASFLKHQLKCSEENNQTAAQIIGHDNISPGGLIHEKSSLPQKLVFGVNGPEQMPRKDDILDQDLGTLTGELKSEKCKKVLPLYQRVLSALIADYGTKEFQENDGRNRFSQYCGDDPHGALTLSVDVDSKSIVRIDSELPLNLRTQKHCAADGFSCNGNTFTSSQNVYNQFKDNLFEGDHAFMPSHNGVVHELPENGLDGPLATHMNGSVISSSCFLIEQCLEDNLMLELRSVGLSPENVPYLSDEDDDAINQEILELEKEFNQQVGKTKTHLNKISKEVQEVGEIGERVHREKVAMDKLTELAYRKLLATRGSIASKLGVPRVPKQTASAFMKRTLARCRRFENSGESCFCEPALRDALLATPTCRTFPETTALPPDAQNTQPETGSFPRRTDLHDHNCRGGRSSFNSSDLDFAKTGPISNRGKKKEVLLDDVGVSATMRGASALGSTLLGGAKGKRSERERDKDVRNARSGRPSASSLRGDRKAKAKPKQKMAQLLSSVNGYIDSSDHRIASAANEVVASANGSNRERESGLMSQGDSYHDVPKELNDPMELGNLPLSDLDTIGLGVGTELVGNQDLDNWFNIDEDGLQDHDFAGLEIPMDDLSELNFM